METERKYLQPDFALLRQRLAALGAITAGPYFEHNLVLDTDSGQLKAQKRLLRLRSCHWPEHTEYVLTFKYLPENVRELYARGVKAREELELGLEDGSKMLEILRLMGYAPCLIYEKVRESWKLAFANCQCEIDLDQMPFMEVAEVEAPTDLQDGLALALGLDKCKISLKNYDSLHQEWRREQGLGPMRDILFTDAQKDALPFAFR